MTGGGSGGHITPLLAVAHELKKHHPEHRIIYIGQKGDSLADIPAEDKNIDEVYLIHAGKFRRYHGETLWQHLKDVPTIFKNIRDAFKVIVGLFQSFVLLRKLRPDVIFIKGGFVCVPVGLTAALLRIPYITHDSDALPGLANRIVAPWAKKNTVGLPKEVYSYPAEKSITVGVPLLHHYKPLTKAEQQGTKKQLGLPEKGKVLLITGGGLGAQRLNMAIEACAKELLERYPDLTIIHIAGRALEAELRQRYQKNLPKVLQQRITVKGFITNLYAYSGIADVIVARAGASSIAEFAAQHKACIIVPNPLLTGGHQLKNAKVWADRGVIKVVGEDKLRIDDHALMPPLVDLLDNPKKATLLGEKLGDMAEPDAAKRLAMLLLDIAK